MEYVKSTKRSNPLSLCQIHLHMILTQYDIFFGTFKVNLIITIIYKLINCIHL